MIGFLDAILTRTTHKIVLVITYITAYCVHSFILFTLYNKKHNRASTFLIITQTVWIFWQFLDDSVHLIILQFIIKSEKKDARYRSYNGRKYKTQNTQ